MAQLLPVQAGTAMFQAAVTGPGIAPIQQGTSTQLVDGHGSTTVNASNAPQVSNFPWLSSWGRRSEVKAEGVPD